MICSRVGSWAKPCGGRIDVVAKRNNSTPSKQVPGKLVGALKSGLSVLAFLSQAERPMGVSEIARELSLNTSTCFNLLKTLVHEGLLDFDPAAKAYTISFGMLRLVGTILEKDGLSRVSRPYLEQIASNRGVTTTLWRLVAADRMMLIDFVPNYEQISIHMKVGQRLPSYLAAFGRCMAAHRQLADEELKRAYADLRWQNAPSFDTYKREVELARVHGYAVDRDNFVRGVTTISSLIFKNQVPIGALSTVGISGQFTSDDLNYVAADLKQAAQEISEEFAGHLR
ncbi:Transcriptional regulator [Hyphomicrobiales bacterium]|nr:Transcriptional regulator [Hyphomicrobiales bacterium]CAH1691994.1 IclR family transcriptional regulator [Hyphomicrobiales bacterium]